MGHAADTRWSLSLSAAAELLMSAKREVQDEIHDYPAQIAGCDLAFKLLAETRDRLVEALYLIEQARAGGTAPDDLRVLLAHVQSIDGLSDARKHAFARCLE